MGLHVAISIVGFRNNPDILNCIAALEQSEHKDFEVIVCENGGPESHADLVARAPAALAGGQTVRIVLAEGNLGFPGGVNRCLTETPYADAWWVLNPDTVPRPDALSALVARLEAGDCDAVGCTLLAGDGTVGSYGGRWQAWIARAKSIGMGEPFRPDLDAAAIEARQNYLHGASILVGRRFLETVGLLRAEYFLYCEEVEWCLRGLARGMRLGFAPGAFVVHHQGTTTGSGGSARTRSRLPVYLNERNKLLLTRDLFVARLPVAVVLSLGLILVRYGREGAWRQMGQALAGWWAGVRNERGPPAWLKV